VGCLSRLANGVGSVLVLVLCAALVLGAVGCGTTGGGAGTDEGAGDAVEEHPEAPGAGPAEGEGSEAQEVAETEGGETPAGGASEGYEEPGDDVEQADSGGGEAPPSVEGPDADWNVPVEDPWANARARPADVVEEEGRLKVLPLGHSPVFFDEPAGYTAVQVDAACEPYSVEPDLSNVENGESFSELSKEQREFLARNLFVAAKSRDEQLFYVYERNVYKEIPSFYTTDLFLQLYHLIYDYTLRDAEILFMKPVLEELTLDMLGRSLEQHATAREPLVRTAAVKNAAYFATAARLLGIEEKSIPELPEEARRLADREVTLVLAHEGRKPSALFPYQLDYTQFIPRGHYTRTPSFERYFRAMMWYGLVPFPSWRDGDGGPIVAEEQLVQAMLMARAIEDPAIASKWETVYEPTVFYVGKTDDLSVMDARRMMESIWGESPDIDSLADVEKLERLVAEMEKPENQPRIQQVLVGIPTGVQFRFMGQRYIPDSEILQELSCWPHRPLPKGLDVPGVLGSARAEELLFELYEEPKAWPDYAVEFPRLREQFSEIPEETWRSNLYYGWLWALQPLIDEEPEGAPSFTRAGRWEDKQLETYLGSWSELRHDTILYAKAMCAECGDEWKVLPQYVEPEPEFYNRLAWLANRTGYGLAKRGLLHDDTALVLDGFVDLLEFARDIAVKELTGTAVTEDELRRLQHLGAEVEYLSIRTVGPYGHWGNLLSDADRHMAVIADIGTSGGDCLEVGVGPAKHVYVVFPFEGRLYIGRGAMFAYYEFTWLITDRLTDEAWREMLESGDAPEQQEWIRSYTIGDPLDFDWPSD